MIRLENVSYTYPSEKVPALSSVTLDIKGGTVTAVTGRAGSGKTTLSEIIGGITAPTVGTVTFDGKPASECRTHIGTVFQNPEYQLFAETVYNDIAYGPKNRGLNGTELDERVRSAAAAVGLDPALLDAEPFELSGGEKRLAAIAGILAMQPRILVLDEPAAGLDPRGRRHIFELIRELKDNDPEMTVIFVTHSMEDAAEYAEDVIVLNDGKVAAQGNPHEIFNNSRLLSECGLDIPEAVRIAHELKVLGTDIGNVITTDEAYNAILALMRGGGGYAR